MADAYTTKTALADALKNLIAEKPFSKICISELCARCGLHRKSFYYHFRDKYELVAWMFDTECRNALSAAPQDSRESRFLSLCTYLYDNRALYRKLFRIEGQNSLIDHVHAIVRANLPQTLSPFALTFYSDGLSCALKRWLSEKSPMPPEAFLQNLKSVSPL